MFILLQLLVEYLFFAGILGLVVFYSECKDRDKVNSFLFVSRGKKTGYQRQEKFDKKSIEKKNFLGFKKMSRVRSRPDTRAGIGKNESIGGRI